MGLKEYTKSDFNQKLQKAMGVNEKQPYISVNKLAEYQCANSTRRREIVKQLKQDKDFNKMYYQQVKVSTPKYFKERYNINVIDKAIAKLKSKIENEPEATKWDTDDRNNSILALKRLKDAILPDISDYAIVTDLNKLTSIYLAGVEVTIKPELYFKNINTDKIGALKLHIAKTEKNRLTLEGMQYVSTILKYGFIEHGYDLQQIDNNACISLDVFQGNFGVAPAGYKRNINALTYSCEEIALRWPFI